MSLISKRKTLRFLDHKKTDRVGENEADNNQIHFRLLLNVCLKMKQGVWLSSSFRILLFLLMLWKSIYLGYETR